MPHTAPPTHDAPPNGTSPRVGAAAPHTTATEPTSLFAPRLGPDAEPCGACGAALAADQRYCLSCGTRRAGLRVPFPVAAPPAPATPPPAPVIVPRPRRAPLPAEALVGMAAAAALGLGLLGGALIVRANDDPPAAAAVVQPAATATPMPTVVPTAAPTVAATATAVAAFVSDWPDGQEGWTVQLQVLPKDGTTPDQVAAAKADASGKGAAEVGALDSDSFPTLDGGNYVVYAGNYGSKKDAEAAVDTTAFPDAKAVQVSTSAPTPTPTPTAEFKSPEEAQKKLRDAPDKVQSEGTPPPADNKAPGAGSETEDFG